MKHARKDYDRIQDPLNLIPAGEPVFLLRGQDVCATDVLAHYCYLLEKYGVAENANTPIVQAVQEHIRRVRNWQQTVKIKQPDLPSEGEMNNVLNAYYNASKSGNASDLSSYIESDANLRTKVKQLEENLESTVEQFNNIKRKYNLVLQERNGVASANQDLQRELQQARALSINEDFENAIKAMAEELKRLSGENETYKQRSEKYNEAIERIAELENELINKTMKDKE